MSARLTTAEALAGMPTEVRLEQLVDALVGFGVAPQVAGRVARATLHPDRLVVVVIVDDRGSDPLTLLVPVSRRDPDEIRLGPRRVQVHRAPVLRSGEVPCARELCGDGYSQHGVDGVLGACTVCLCRGFLWVAP